MLPFNSSLIIFKIGEYMPQCGKISSSETNALDTVFVVGPTEINFVSCAFSSSTDSQ